MPGEQIRKRPEVGSGALTFHPAQLIEGGGAHGFLEAISQVADGAVKFWVFAVVVVTQGAAQDGAGIGKLRRDEVARDLQRANFAIGAAELFAPQEDVAGDFAAHGSEKFPVGIVEGDAHSRVGAGGHQLRATGNVPAKGCDPVKVVERHAQFRLFLESHIHRRAIFRKIGVVKGDKKGVEVFAHRSSPSVPGSLLRSRPINRPPAAGRTTSLYCRASASRQACKFQSASRHRTSVHGSLAACGHCRSIGASARRSLG